MTLDRPSLRFFETSDLARQMDIRIWSSDEEQAIDSDLGVT